NTTARHGGRRPWGGRPRPVAPLRPVLPFTAPWFFSISRRSSPALIWLDQPGDPISELHRQAHRENQQKSGRAAHCRDFDQYRDDLQRLAPLNVSNGGYPVQAATAVMAITK